MRLLTRDNNGHFTLTADLRSHEIPRYAILSHTWGASSDEVDFTDMQQGRAANKIGYEKIEFCGRQAEKDKIKHFWVDTCCINKSDSSELSEAINSMYRWYRNAEKCYVYLADVPTYQIDDDLDKSSVQRSSVRSSRWFTRGWTLQELLAPKVVEFFSRDGTLIGTKRTLAGLIHGVTTIPLAVLYGASPTQFPVDERWQWAQGRQTSRIEDGAYCLFGIFDVFLPPIYGEGEHAFLRLEKEINARSAVRVRTPTANDHIETQLISRSGSNLTQHPSADEEHTGRVSKRRKLGQAEASKMQDHSQAVQRMQSSKEDFYDRLVKSLIFDRMDFRVNNVKKALLSTCEWLLCHPDFLAWSDSATCITPQHDGFLWIKGKPGCGKSTLMKAALDWARNRNNQNDIRQTIVPYFFNARASTSLEKSALGLYRTVVYHLISTHDALWYLFMNKFGLKSLGSDGEPWTKEELQEFLFDCVESGESCGLCLFVDALDEAESENDIRQMLRFLVQLSDRASAASGSCKLQICLSSRHYPYIGISKGVSLVVEEQPEHRLDIEIYIDKQLTHSEGPAKDALRATVLRRSACIFLWVVLVVEILNELDDRGASLSKMMARLETIPDDLNDLFRDILVKGNDDVALTILFFQWSVFCLRPLEPAELFVAMEYSQFPTDSDWSPPHTIAIPDRGRLARYILNCSHGLVEVVEVAPGQPPVVQFIHESVREFLITNNGLTSILPPPATNLVGTSNNVMRIACQRCVSANPVIPKEYQPQHRHVNLKDDASWKAFRSGIHLRSRFLEYAVKHLFDHADQAQRHGVSQQAFVEMQVARRHAGFELYRLWWSVFQRQTKSRSDVTLLYFLVQERSFSLIPLLPDLTDLVDRCPEGCDTVLQSVSAQGNLQMVQLFIAAGAEVDAEGVTYGNALQAASAFAHPKVVQTLLKAGANANEQGGPYGNALCAASRKGCVKTVQMLLNAGAQVDMPSEKYGDALSIAMKRGHQDIVDVLLNAGALMSVAETSYEDLLLEPRDRSLSPLLHY